VTLFGDPRIRAGAPFTYSGVRPGVDGIEFVIETATHTISKGGYTTQVEAKLKTDGKVGGKGSGKREPVQPRRPPGLPPARDRRRPPPRPCPRSRNRAASGTGSPAAGLEGLKRPGRIARP